MTKQIGERFLKFSSRLPFNKDIALGEDITVIINDIPYIANCVKIEYEDKQNEFQDAIYKLKFTNE